MNIASEMLSILNKKDTKEVEVLDRINEACQLADNLDLDKYSAVLTVVMESLSDKLG